MADQIYLDPPGTRSLRGVSGRRQPRSVLLGVLIVLVAGALAGAASWLQIQGWSSLGTEAGGACGTRYGSCPPGSTPVLVGSFVAIPAALFTCYWRPRRLFLLLLVLGLVGGGFAGLHGVSLSVKWTTPFDGPSTLTTQGVWVQANSVVRIRVDQVVSYADATGAAQWTFPIPGQSDLWTTSRFAAFSQLRARGSPQFPFYSILSLGANRVAWGCGQLEFRSGRWAT